MIWANFLHAYQPPTQKQYWVDRVTHESYRPFFGGLLSRPHIKATININSVLVELLHHYGHDDVINDLRKLLERGQIELTASAKYHPLLTFIPEYEAIRQIKLNDQAHKKFFGEAYQPRGFFPPEMAFNKNVAKIAAEAGYEWIIVDELSYDGGKNNIDYSKRYEVEGLSGFGIYFRERQASWTILSGELGTKELFLNYMRERLKRDEYLLTAMDLETFGHHRPALQNLLFELCDAKELPNELISNIPQYFKQTASVDPLPSTWALMQKDLERDAPFSRWNDPDNEIHVLQWKLTKLAISLYEDEHSKPALTEDTLDRALHSDQYWWASARPWWSVEMIEAGAKELLDAIKNATKSQKIIHEAQTLYQEILSASFAWQRTGKVDEIAKSEDEDVRQRTDAHMPKLPKKEVAKMVAQLQRELDKVLAAEEYERAVQLRDRIKEVKAYAADVKNAKPTEEGDSEWTD